MIISQIFGALDTRRLLIAILFVAIFTMAVRVPTDTDTWWHLRSGEYILRTHSIPRHDVFSHTVAGKPWIDHGWLAQIAIYLLYTAFGYAGLGLALAAVVTLTFVFVFLQSEENLYLKAFITVLAAITSAGPYPFVDRPLGEHSRGLHRRVHSPGLLCHRRGSEQPAGTQGR
jgi:hypothetical protein